MASERSASSYLWNPGGWFGGQIGGTLWLLILGAVVLPKDPMSALLCFCAFAALNAWGCFLWRRRDRLSAHAGLQAFFGAAAVAVALVVVVLRARGASEPAPPGALVSTWLPYWVVAVVPALMLAFFLRERAVRRRP